MAGSSSRSSRPGASLSTPRSSKSSRLEAGDEATAGAAAPVGLLLRGSLGGVLMGLANLVPGISGGTMLLATGVYPAFIAAIADVTRLRLRARPLLLLAVVAGAAGLAILLLAGPTQRLVVEHRWAAYAAFIGLTLGGVPLVWRLARPATPGTWAGAGVGLALMVVMALAPEGESAAAGPDTFRLALSGMAGAGAMILPGVSGGYLLLLLGQYLPILGAIDRMREGLLAVASGEAGLAVLLDPLAVVAPVGLGVVLGVVGISNLLRLALERFPKPTLGFLLGLLLGAVIGLWPFQQGVPPQEGDVVRGRALSAAEAAAIQPEDWRLERFAPSGGQAGGALALLGLGFALTTAIDRLGRGTAR